MPEMWKRTRLADVLDVLHGYPFPGEAMSEELTGGPIVVNIGNFNYRGGFRFYETRTREFNREYPEQFNLDPGDLLIAMTCQTSGGEILGLPGIVPGDGRTYLHNQRIGKVVVKSELLDKRFAYYTFLSPAVNRQLVTTASGTKILHTAPARVRAVQVNLPSFSEQRRIATLLEVLDDKISVNDRIAGTCHKIAELYYQQATLKVPEVPLSSIVEPVLGGTPDRAVAAYWGPGNPWASAKDVAESRFGILIDTAEEITDLAVSETKAKPLPKGSVVLTARGTVGAVTRFGQPTSFNQSCYAFTPKRLPPAALYLTMRWAAQRMLNVAHGTVFSTVTMKTFDHIFVPSIQDAELSALESHTGPLLGTIECRVRESSNLAQLRDTLLPKLMSGEIRVREAEEMVAGAT